MIPSRIAVSSLVLTLLTACGAGDDRQGAATPEALAASASSAQRGKATDPITPGTTGPISLALFVGKYADYTLLRTAAGLLVTPKAGGEARTIPSEVGGLAFDDVIVSPSTTGIAAQTFRLYQAAFDRAPDITGLGFHISVMEGAGVSLTQVAQGFVDSPEFTSRYGALGNAAFLTQLYQNILHRAPDPAGLAYWLGLLDGKALSRGQVLAGFADSPENVLLVAPAIENGIAYVPYISGTAGTAVTLTEANVPWNAAAPLNLVLRDARGQVVPNGSLTCSVASAVTLSVSADCRSATGLHLGQQDIVVKGGGVSATLRLRVIPQRKPFGTSGNTEHFNLMATAGGNAIAWGWNNQDVIGQGVPGAYSYNLPVLVKNAAGAGPLLQVAATAAGEIDAMALLESGEVVAWSDGHTFGRQAASKGLPLPVRNPANDGNLQRVVQLQVGQGNAVALTDSGRVMTWGQYHGQGVSAAAAFPNEVKHPSGSGSLTGIVAIAAGGSFGLALADSGKVYAWGWNSVGELGRGTKSDPQVLAAAVIKEDGSELDNIVAISAGYRFSLALTADGRVYAWGGNSWGELGQDKTFEMSTRAILVKDSSGTGVLSNIAMVSAGGHHALALDTAGRVLSWGYEEDGALGEGANRARVGEYRPMYVVGVDGTGVLDNIATIAASSENSQALRKDGAVLVWGSGFGAVLGQGDGSTTEVAVPRIVKNLAGTGKLVLPPAGYHNLLNRGR